MFWNINDSNSMTARDAFARADKTPISQYVTVLNTSNAVNLAGENIVNKFYNSIFVNDSNYKHESNIESLFQGPRVFLYDVIIDKAYTPGSGSRILLVKNAQELFFNDLDKSDFSLRNYSPAIGFGSIITGINNDIQGKNRPLTIGSKPDIGAFENIFDHPAPYINSDSSINGVILLKMTQNPAGTVNKYNIYKKNIFGFFDRDLGRYCNHSFNPNTYVKETTDDTGYDLYAINDIELGEEILVNYTLMEQLSNVPPNTFYKSNFNEIKQTFIIKNLI